MYIYTVHSGSSQTPFTFLATIVWILFFTLIYTRYAIMTKWKENFRNVNRFIKKEELKYDIAISIQTFTQHFIEAPVAAFLGTMLQALHTWIQGSSAILLFQILSVTSSTSTWMLREHTQVNRSSHLFSSLRPSLTWNGPKQSIPLKVTGGVASVLSGGR